MPTYHYQALDAEEQLVTGQVQAESVREALAQLESAGLSVQSISVAGENAAAESTSPIVAPVPHGESRPVILEYVSSKIP